MELEEFVKSVLAQIGKGIAAYRRDGGVAVLFPDAVTFEVHLRGTWVGQRAARQSQGGVSARVLAERAFAPGRPFCVVQGKLLEEPVEALVNAANGRLAHGGGVAGLISRAAGPALQEECDRIVRECGVLPAGHRSSAPPAGCRSRA